MSVQIIPVILCGGSGTRLWPLSRQKFPKQFVELSDGKTLFDLTLARVASLSNKPIIVSNQEHRFLINRALAKTQIESVVLLEPCGRNTAPAIALATCYAAQNNKEEDPILLFLPADHHIPDGDLFCQMILAAASNPAVQNAITIFGVVPTYPATEYGYIHYQPAPGQTAYDVQKFIEKPDRQGAEDLLATGNVLWNAGIFMARRSVMQQAIAQSIPDTVNKIQEILIGLGDAVNEDTVDIPQAMFEQIRSESFDVAVMEKWPATKVVPFQGVWSDVGGWNALGGLWSEDQNNNHVLGNQAYLHKTHTSLVKASGRPVVTLGLENTLIVDTLDVLLVANRNHLDQMRDIVAGMSKVYPALTENHRQVRRPWGWYDSIEQGPGFQVKRLHLDAGASISLQRHKHRAEHWVIVAGHAKVQIEDKITLLSAGQSAYIPLGAVHRLINPADYPLEVVEVQTGDYLGEDDIERLEDIYGRVKNG